MNGIEHEGIVLPAIEGDDGRVDIEPSSRQQHKGIYFRTRPEGGNGTGVWVSREQAKAAVKAIQEILMQQEEAGLKHQEMMDEVQDRFVIPPGRVFAVPGHAHQRPQADPVDWRWIIEEDIPGNEPVPIPAPAMNAFEIQQRQRHHGELQQPRGNAPRDWRLAAGMRPGVPF